MKLFSVERRTKTLTRGRRKGSSVHCQRYAVMAEDADKARAMAVARCPQDELDGPEVLWEVTEEPDGIVFCRDVIRQGSLS